LTSKIIIIEVDCLLVKLVTILQQLIKIKLAMLIRIKLIIIYVRLASISLSCKFENK